MIIKRNPLSVCLSGACVVVLLFWLEPSARAYQADEKSKVATRATSKSTKEDRRRTPSADQATAAQLGEAAGMRVQWHSHLGTPRSIRGRALGQRGAYSGGKGLALGHADQFESNAVAVLDNLSRFYRIQDAAAEFVLKRHDGDALGHRHVRLSQVHRGLPVVGGELLVHFDAAGEPYEVNGQYVADVAVEAVPKLDADGAVGSARADLLALGYPEGGLVQAPALVVFGRDMPPRLAYELVLTYDQAADGPGRWRYWVDAEDGTVLLRYNDIKHINPPSLNGAPVPITGNILAGEGGQSLTVTGWRENTGTHYLYQTNRHWYVYNVATSGYGDNATYAYRTNATWGTSDRTEMSAARNFDVVQRYFLEAQGRNSFNNGGLYARANVHQGINYVNAYWDGSAFYFGDGDGIEANSLAVLDICAHEYAHAVTEYTSDLVYSYEPGALNESFSDIFGTCVEWYAQPDGRGSYPGKTPGLADWLCGEDSWLSSVALRDMRNPRNTATVGAGNEQPSRYRGAYWYTGTGDNGGVHINSGVQNFFFHLLCEGGSGDNDGLLYNVAGIGITNAQQVAYRALTVYCTPNTDYADARSAWNSAALDLNPNWAGSVSAAWSAVGIGALSAEPISGLTFRGPTGGPFSPAAQTITLANADAGPLTWALIHHPAWLTATPTNGVLSAAGSSPVTLAVNASAGALPAGIHTNVLTFLNAGDGARIDRPIRLLVGQPDYYTELFELADNDLDYQTWTFTPDGSAAYYAACREVATNVPTDPAGGITLSLGDDAYAQVTLSGTNTVAIYSRRTNTFFIGSNGYLTMNAGDTDLSESLLDHFDLPRVSACFDDLNPSTGGTVSWKQTTNCVAVTFANVREYGTTATVSFQIELFYDGRIRLTCLGIGITDGLAGLSEGQGVPAGFIESDLSSYGACAPPDGLVVTPATGLSAQGYEGGPFAPSNASYVLGNGTTNSLAWSASATADWIGLSASGGVLASATSTNVSVGINSLANALAPGLYNAVVTFSNLGSGFTHTRGVTLRVLAIPGEIAVWDSIPPTTDLQMPFGDTIVGLSRTEQVVITNSDPAHLLVLSRIGFGRYEEDFEDGLAQDWDEVVDAHWQVVSGEYRAQTATFDMMMQSAYAGEVWADCEAAMTVRRAGYAGSAAALVWRATADYDEQAGVGSAYGVGMSGLGNYWVGKTVGGTFTFLQSWTASPYLNTGETTNQVVVRMSGSAIQVYFNGHLAWSGSDSSITAAGRIGLWAYRSSGGETVYYFDNVSAGVPNPVAETVSLAQAWYNAHPLGGATPTEAPDPANAATYSGPPDGGSSLAPVQFAGVSSGSFVLTNLPNLPYVLPPGGELSFEVTHIPGAVGPDDAIIVVESNDADESRVEVQVTGRGVPDYLAMSPATDLVGQGHPGGPFNPSSITYTLSNISPVGISWTALASGDWISVQPATGSLLPGASVEVEVGFSAQANSLTVGEYLGQVMFSNQTTTVWQRRNVSLTVFTSPQIVVDPGSIAVTNPLGGRTLTTVMVSNAITADANLTFRVSARETGRSTLALAASGVGRPPAGRDFTRAISDVESPVDRLLVRFADGVVGAQRTQLLSALGGAQIAREYQLVPGLCLVKLPAEQTIEVALKTYNQSPGILYAEPDYLVQADATIPNDTRFGELWGMHNTGQTGGTPDADIDAPEAWDLSTGNGQVLVAVIDTGVDYNHPDLTNNIWTNPGEVPGNGLDDDGNGYVDDVHGYDFYNDDGDPMDDVDHGTHVAGTIGAEAGNDLGVAGVCWDVRIMAVKFLGVSGGSTADAVSAVEYATRMGARVMNNSWGGGAYSQALKDAIDAAGTAGSVFVAAAGNDGINNDTTPHYPSSYDSSNIIAVLNTDHNDLRAASSCYGLVSVDLGAPGSSILSTVPGGGYEKFTGTSMASPHVAGACALLLSANLVLSVAEIKSNLLSTVDATLPGLCVSGGRLNLANALASVRSPWLTVTPSGATNQPPGAAITLVVGVDAAGLDPGIYQGELRIACNDVLNPGVIVPVTMTVLAEHLQVTPEDAFVSRGAEGGPFAPAQTAYTVTNTGLGTVQWQVVHAGNWLSLSPSGGSLAAGESALVTAVLTSDAELLAPGAYTNTLVFSNRLSGGVRPRQAVLNVVTPSLRIADASQWEGESGSTNLVLSVALDPVSTRPVQVSFATANETALAGSDYIATNGLLNFLPGQTNASVMVTVIGDPTREPNETFAVNLSNPVNAVLGRARATATILSDDLGPFADDFDPDIDPFQWTSFGDSGTSFAVRDGFEAGYFSPDWDAYSGVGILTGVGAMGSSRYARLSAYNGAGQMLGARFDQAVSGGVQHFYIDCHIRVLSTSERQFNLMVSTSGSAIDNLGPAINLRYQSGQGGWAAYDGAGWRAIAGLGPLTPGQWHRLRVSGQGWGTGVARYSIQLSSAGGSTFTSSASNLSWYQTGNPNLERARFCVFTSTWGNSPGFEVDEVEAGSGWVVACNYGGSVSSPNSLWFGGAGTRLADSRSLDTSLGGDLDFWLRIANGTSNTWEVTDLPYEGIVLEYSINNGSTWTELGRYDTAVYQSWTRVTKTLPPAARTPNTRFRWRQLSHSGIGFDHWALDNVNALVGPRAPTLITQPANQTVPVGSTATFCVVASGSEPMGYQWWRDGAPLTGATQSCYSLSYCQFSDSGSQFRCVVSNAFGNLQSSNATLAVVPVLTLGEAVDAPHLTWITGGTAPWVSETTNTHDATDAAQSGVITHSQETWLEATVQGPGTLSFWWSVSSEFSFDYLEFRTNGVLVTGISGSVAWNQRTVRMGSGPRTLRWRYMKDGSVNTGQDRGWLDQVVFVPDNPQPVIVSQPADQTAMVGAPASFCVGASGSVPLGYRWFRDGAPIAEASQSCYTLTNCQFADSGSRFSCLVSNAYGSVLSSNATLTVLPYVPVITQSNVFYPNVLTYTFYNMPPPAGPGTLTVSALADLDLPSEYLTLNGEGVLTSNLFVTGGLQMSAVSTVVNLTRDQLAALAADGVITFTLTPSPDVNNLGPSYARLDLQYPSAGVLHHFTWEPVSPTQRVNVPFPVALTARDILGDIVTNYDGLASIRGQVGLGLGAVLEDFESGIWPHSPWVALAGGTVSSLHAHDGAYGLSDPDWAYRTDTPLGAAGDVLSWWIRPSASASGRAYLGFAASASGCWSIVAAQNTSTFLLQRNTGYGYADVASRPQTWQANRWYKVAVEFASSTSVVCKLYDADGTTLLNSISYVGVNGLPGGVAIRSFGSFSLDTITRGGGGSGQIATTPTNTGPFVAGVWSGDVTVLEVATNMVLVANDPGGHSGTSDAFNVIRNLPPVADAGLDQTNECAGAGTTVELDGRGSSDPDGDPLAFEWRLGGMGLGTNALMTVTLPLGVHEFTLTVTDPFGASDTDLLLVEVADTTPPALTCPTNVVVEFADANGAVANYVVTATDGCSEVSLQVVPPSGSLFPIGISSVQATAADTSGNQSNCGFDVVVLGAWGVKGNVLAELRALQATCAENTPSALLAEAITELLRALDPALWIDQTHIVWNGGDVVFHGEKNAVRALERLKQRGSDCASEWVLGDMINRMVKADRLLAVVSINDAASAGARPNKIAEDLKQLEKGDEFHARGLPELAIESYRHAWKHSAHMGIKTITTLADGRIQIEFLGIDGLEYRIEASTNLVDWELIGTATTDAEGKVRLLDSAASQHPLRYYRAIQP